MVRPRVGLVCDTGRDDGHVIHRVNQEYVEAVRDGAGALPLLIPALNPPLDVAELVASFDGFCFTGAVSNVDPARYGGPAPRNPALLDAARDALTLDLIRAAIAAGKPVLAICRGFQELNVALGGTLFQHVHEQPGRMDHREDETAPLEVQFGPAHPISIVPDGVLAGIAGLPPGKMGEAVVNSLHHQGVDRLAPGLRLEATAPDGQVEAVSLLEPAAFLLGVQWHPEWRWGEAAFSRAIFSAFGEALNYGKK
jgi:putative glutamine amidotransferase